MGVAFASLSITVAGRLLQPGAIYRESKRSIETCQELSRSRFGARDALLWVFSLKHLSRRGMPGSRYDRYGVAA
jgi:hypothetical protein